MREDGMIQYTCEKCSDQYTQTIPATQQIRILFIANSFGEDSAAYLWHVLSAAGFRNVVVAVAYYGGCTINKHWEFIQNNSAEYEYKKITLGFFNNRGGMTLEKIVEDEPWDIISIQQSGSNHYSTSTFSHMDDLIGWVEQHKTNPKAKYVYNMPWTYPSYCTDWTYLHQMGGNSDQMYASITDAVQQVVVGHPAFDRIIPSGTVVQNLRNSFLTESALYRDELHLSLTIGRYAVALGWYCALLDGNPEDISWAPSTIRGDDATIAVICEAIHNALERPFEMTPCVTPKEQ